MPTKKRATSVAIDGRFKGQLFGLKDDAQSFVEYFGDWLARVKPKTRTIGQTKAADILRLRVKTFETQLGELRSNLEERLAAAKAKDSDKSHRPQQKAS